MESIERYEADSLEPLIQLIQSTAEEYRKAGKTIPNMIVNPKVGMKFVEAKTILSSSLPKGSKLVSKIDQTYGIAVLTVRAKQEVFFSRPDVVANVIERGGILEVTGYLNGNIEVDFTFHGLFDELGD